MITAIEVKIVRDWGCYFTYNGQGYLFGQIIFQLRLERVNGAAIQTWGKSLPYDGIARAEA